MNMPLSRLIERLLRGDAAELHDEDFHSYVNDKIGNNHESLQQALTEIENAIKSKGSKIYQNTIDKYY